MGTRGKRREWGGEEGKKGREPGRGGGERSISVNRAHIRDSRILILSVRHLRESKINHSATTTMMNASSPHPTGT